MKSLLRDVIQKVSQTGIHSGLGIATLMFAIVPFFMNAALYNLARFSIVIGSITGALICQYCVGINMHVEVHAFLLGIYMVNLFDHKEVKLTGIFLTLSLLYFVSCYAFQYGIFSISASVIPEDKVNIFNIIACTTIFIIFMLTALLQRNIFYKQNNKIQLLNEELERNLVLKSTLNNIVVHDMSTPIMIIRRMVGNLVKTNSSQAQELDLLSQSNESLDNILNNVKALMVDIDKVKEMKETIKVEQVIKEVEMLTRNRFADKNIHLDIICKNPKQEITTNKSLVIDNILLNILTNSVKFTESRESVRFVVEKCNDYVKFSSDLINVELIVRNREDQNNGLEFISRIPVQ